jgi:hypothetical protein
MFSNLATVLTVKRERQQSAQILPLSPTLPPIDHSAFKMVNHFRIQATSATFSFFPALTSR